ncbi:hypothetical protein [Allocoleopsis sp.]|uniref:hypothetical protein n=1 Tax=Allocoleopsis sp. TaxID=3088169 RepID=UPI002FD002AF
MPYSPDARTSLPLALSGMLAQRHVSVAGREAEGYSVSVSPVQTAKRLRKEKAIAPAPTRVRRIVVYAAMIVLISRKLKPS